MDLPTDGKTGDDLMRVLEELEGWIWKWEQKEYDWIENELQNMILEGKCLRDIALWKSFLEYLKSLDQNCTEEVENPIETIEIRETCDLWKDDSWNYEMIDIAGAKQLWGYKTWPPSWFQTEESIMSHWELVKNTDAGRVLTTIYFVRRTRGYLPPCVSDILVDIHKEQMIKKEPSLLNGCAKLLYYLLPATAEGIDEALLVVWSDLSVATCISVSEWGMERGSRLLYRVLQLRPGLAESLHGTEKGRLVVANLQRCLERRTGTQQAYAIKILIRVPYSIGVPLPIDGHTSMTEKRKRILDVMDRWVWEGYIRRCGVLEEELDRMKGYGVRWSEIARWESFLEYLRSFEVGRQVAVFKNGLVSTSEIYWRARDWKAKRRCLSRKRKEKEL
jgi:hypothetical protein